jgi:hypothetical protein
VRTQAMLDSLVQALQVNCGDLFDAARRCGVSLIFVRQWMKDDADVRDALTEGERVGAMALQSEAIRRAVIGEEKGVYFKGEQVGVEYVKSDGLLQTLLKGRIPETFGADAEGARNVFNGPTQIINMPRAENYDQWLQMKDATLARRDKLDAADRALPAPDTPIIDVTAVPVPASPFEGLGL